MIYDDLKAIVGPKGWLSGAEALQPYINEWRGAVVGATPLALFPKNTQEVAAIVGLCASSRIALVPQGGNTGMCAGAIPDDSGEQVILGLRRMNAIRNVDVQNFSIEVEAGCVLADVQQAARSSNRHFAISLGAEGSCQIGGNLATNAGGINVLRYGTARDQVMGLEVVLADGRVLNGLRALRKDTAGYDLKQLFVGSEGTLGIITAATLKLHPQPSRTTTAMVGLASGEDAIQLLAFLRTRLHDVFEAFELISQPVLQLVIKDHPEFRLPLDDSMAWYVLMEAAADENTVVDALASASDSGLLQDAIVAKNETESKALWRMRHTISEAERRYSSALKHDVSVPVSKLAEFLSRGEKLLSALAPNNTLFAFGHVGDGNLHYNVSLDAHLQDPSRISTAIYDLVHELGGSFSAEHGVGSVKRGFLRTYRSDTEIAVMEALKQTLDPLNILNPGKVI